MVRQWGQEPPSLGQPIFRINNKHKKTKYKVPVPDTRVKQPYEAFLVLDIEGTCELGTDFNYPNEIIVGNHSHLDAFPHLIHLRKISQEFPVCLLQWVDRSNEGLASELRVVDEFRSFVKPTWKPVLSEFCKELTGITQVRLFFFLSLEVFRYSEGFRI